MSILCILDIRQAVHAVKQSILLRCLWVEATRVILAKIVEGIRTVIDKMIRLS
jgi:hypothetical protein